MLDAHVDTVIESASRHVAGMLPTVLGALCLRQRQAQFGIGAKTAEVKAQLQSLRAESRQAQSFVVRIDLGYHKEALLDEELAWIFLRPGVASTGDCRHPRKPHRQPCGSPFMSGEHRA
jgi:hypothetical protein